MSQATWSVQRGVRFVHNGEDFLCLQTYHDGYKNLEPIMLFNLNQDPHEQYDLALREPEVVDKALSLLSKWYHQQLLSSDHDVDPLMTVHREAGPYYTRDRLPEYIERLKKTGRTHHAKTLAKRHPKEL